MMMTKKDIKEKAIQYRMRLFEQYLKDFITIDEFAERMKEVEFDEE